MQWNEIYYIFNSTYCNRSGIHLVQWSLLLHKLVYHGPRLVLEVCIENEFGLFQLVASPKSPAKPFRDA